MSLLPFMFYLQDTFFYWCSVECRIQNALALEKNKNIVCISYLYNNAFNARIHFLFIQQRFLIEIQKQSWTNCSCFFAKKLVLFWKNNGLKSKFYVSLMVFLRFYLSQVLRQCHNRMAVEETSQLIINGRFDWKLLWDLFFSYL